MKETLVHGGDWMGYRERYGRDPLDFSTNLSPLGVPDSVRAALCRGADRIDRYPDPLCRTLTRALAEREGVRPEQLLCGAGGADLLVRAALALAPRRALLTAPTFSDYDRALRLTGCQVGAYELRADRQFQVQPDLLDRITPDLDLLILCEPNNPTGLTTRPAVLRSILARCRQTGTVLLVDECFGSLLDEPEAHTLTPYLEEYPNLLIVKAFTKLYAMAGVRLGYALSADEELLRRMEKAGQSWPVSTLAQEAGLAALGEEDYVRRLHHLLKRERPYLKRGLEALGLDVVPGQANYLLFRCERPLWEPLARRGILVRSCASYRGLDGTWYRIAVRDRADNDILLNSLREVLT